MADEIEQESITNSLLLLRAIDGYGGDISLRLVNELAKAFDGRGDLEAIHYRNRQGELSVEAIDFQI